MDTIRLNPHHITQLNSLSFPIDKSLVAATGSLINAGTSAAPVSVGTVADAKIISVYAKSEAVSGDARVAYLRLYVAGAGGAGEAVRAFCTVDGVAAAGTVNGIHASLSFGDGSGTATGLGNAGRFTLHIPNEASWTSGTLSAIMAEIYSDGTDSDPDGVTEISFMRIVNDGSAKDDVDDDAFLFSIQGFTAGDAKMYSENTSAVGTMAGSLKIKIGANTRYIAVRSTIGS
jgi:hypothetical protein